VICLARISVADGACDFLQLVFLLELTMPCYRPQPASQYYYAHTGKWSRAKIIYPVKRLLDGSRVFPVPKFGSYSDIGTRAPFFRNMTVPCGLCFGCRCDNSRSWALRMMHHTRYSSNNYFVTLTYRPEALPSNGNLRYQDLTDFWKRARHVFQSPDRPFKYFACGEYGDENLRPHYHFAGYDFYIPDLRHYRDLPGGAGAYFLSDALSEVWRHGHVLIGDLTWDSASYVARYVTKKMHGKNCRYMDHFDPESGEFEKYTIQRALQSKGLGKPFYEEHSDEIWNLDGCLFKGKYMIKPPRYYFKQLEKADPERALAVTQARIATRPQFFMIDNLADRELLYSMEAVRLSMQSLKRSL
jgi:hypothetical protein